MSHTKSQPARKTENVLKVDESPVFPDSEKADLMSEKSDTFTEWQTVRYFFSFLRSAL